MAHPFLKLFNVALKKSSEHENFVLKEAEKLIQKGYQRDEVCGVLKKLEASLVDSHEAEIVGEALDDLTI